MLDKIKKVLLYIVLPLTALGTFIYALLSKISSLKSSLEEATVETRLAEVATKLAEKENESKDTEADYDAIRAKYLSEHPDSKS